MASAEDKTVSRVALCSALFAGFAYVSYSVVRNAVCRRRHRGRGARDRERDEQDEGHPVRPTLRTIGHLSVGSQTDLLLGNLDFNNCGILRPLSVQERIRELNLRARQFGDEGIIIKHSPFFQPRSLQCSPWNSPRILSPVDIHQFMSRSAENLNISPPSSPCVPRRKSASRRSLHHYKRYSNGDPDDFGGGVLMPPGSEISTTVTEVHILLKDSEETLKKRLDGLYNKGRVLTPYEAQSLCALLYTREEPLLVRTLTTITNCAAFSANHDCLRDAGCLALLNSIVSNIHYGSKIHMAAIRAVGNLSLHKENMRELKSCIPSLVDRAENALLDEDIDETTLLPILITLTNLAVLQDWHRKYIRFLNTLFRLLEVGPDAIKLQACKLLVNLSCNPSMIPHLLAAHAPTTLLDMLDAKADEEFLLRFTTVLDNITSAVKLHNIEATDLPSEEKAPSPETVFANFYGVDACEKLRNRLFVLSKHQNEEIGTRAKNGYECLNNG